MWKEVTPNRGHAREKRSVPAVTRVSTNPSVAYVSLPQGMTGDGRATIYTDGDRLAYKIGARGTYKVYRASSNSCHRVAVPSQYADRIPFGTTDAVLTSEGGMYVLDLSQFSLAKAAE